MPRYVIGIDLGTTNCAVAYADLGAQGVAAPSGVVQRAGVLQVVSPGEAREEPLLPSFLYLPAPGEFRLGAVSLPWDAEPSAVAGLLARQRGSENAGRLVASAKSWLCHAGVDRTAPLLPVNAPEGVAKISPVAATKAYLEHLRHAWDHAHPEAPFLEQEVLVTVPASFDAVARELTLRAAQQAGYGNLALLEEPQAAFYAWLEAHEDWRERIRPGDLILVVDVGGGTTDFTLIAVSEEDGSLQLERVAVGEHILLGGDNMDLALAYRVSEKLAGKGTKLDGVQFQALRYACRQAKERLWEEEQGEAEAPVTILGRGTGLVGGTIRTALSRKELEETLAEGFFPRCGSEEMPAKARRSALLEMGLPYASDAAVTRHLARFLRQPSAATEQARVKRTASGMACPTHLLFNGGVFQAKRLRERLRETLSGWLAAEGEPPVAELEGEDLMHAVARGAAYYGLARHGKGIRIRAGVPRSYYIGIEPAVPAVPGVAWPLKALTVVPYGMEEGTSLKFPEREFGLITGQPADFRFFTSTVRRDDAPGQMLEEITEELTELAPVEVNFGGEGGGEAVPVTLEATVTETGMLELWCVARDGRRWKLEFNVREHAG